MSLVDTYWSALATAPAETSVVAKVAIKINTVSFSSFFQELSFDFEMLHGLLSLLTSPSKNFFNFIILFFFGGGAINGLAINV